MGSGWLFLEKLAQNSEQEPEFLSALPVVEIAGDHRVLIENHGGVRAYGGERILVNVKYGAVCVCGCGLEVLRMTREQLVIRGRIDSVSLCRRG